MTLVSDEEPVNWQLQKFRPDAPTENFTVINGVDGKGRESRKVSKEGVFQS